MDFLNICSACQTGSELTIQWANNSLPNFVCISEDPCPEANKYNDNNTCKLCNAGSVGKPGCNTCTYDGTTYSCKSCLPNYSAELSSPSRPCKKNCESGEYINPENTGCRTCDSIVQGCSSCSDFSNACTECVIGKYLFNNQCKNCHTSCKTCIDVNSNNCLSCTPPRVLQNRRCILNCPAREGYSYSSSSCVPCSQNTSHCSECELGTLKCTKCESPYKINTSNSTCELNCSLVETNCATCSSSIQCDSCNAGYFLKKNSNHPNQCVLCSQTLSNCSKCHYNNNTLVCDKCGTNKTWSNSENKCIEKCSDSMQWSRNSESCVPCDSITDNCATCKFGTVECLSCKQQYGLSSEKKCIECSTLSNNCNKCQNNSGEMKCTGCSSPYVWEPDNNL